MSAPVILHRPNLASEYHDALQQSQLKKIWIGHNFSIFLASHTFSCLKNLAIHASDHLLKKIVKMVISLPIHFLVASFFLLLIWTPCFRKYPNNLGSRSVDFPDPLGNWQLHESIFNLNTLKALTQIESASREELVRQNNIGMTPLHVAALKGNSVVAFTLYNGLSPRDRSIQDIFGNTAIHLALLAFPAGENTANSLLYNLTSQELNIRNKDGITPHMIITYRHLTPTFQVVLNKIYNRAATGVLATGLTTARTCNEQTPVGRCARHPLFEPRLMRLIQQYIS